MKTLVLALFAAVAGAAIALAVLVTRSSTSGPDTESHDSPATVAAKRLPPPRASLRALPDEDLASAAQRGAPPPASSSRPDPHARRATDRAELEASGRTSAAWTRGASDVFATTGLEGSSDVQFGPVECFAAGCITTATYADYAAYNAVNRTVPDSEAFRQWPGSKRRSPPELLPNGRLAADWTLFPPVADEQLAMRQGESP